MKVVRIDWIDSCASNLRWEFPEDFKSDVGPIIITTYGIVFQETDKVITVAQNYGYNPKQVCSLMTIPKGCIQSIKEIDQIEEGIELSKDTHYEENVEVKGKKTDNGIEIPFGSADSELQEATYHIPKGFHAEIKGDIVLIKKGKQKPEWSEEDEHRLKDTIYFLDTAKKHYANTVELDACIDWLKSIKDKHTWKPSEEQIIELRRVISGCSYDIEPLVKLETKLKEL